MQSYNGLFNAQSFMEMQYRAELDTSFTPVPFGEYLAQLTKIELRVVHHENINPPHGVGVGFQGTWQLAEDAFGCLAAAVAATKIPQPTVRQGFLLDILHPEAIDQGKAQLDTNPARNVRLGALLAVQGLNKKSGWRIFDLLHMRGGIRVGQGRSNADGEAYPEVKAVITLEDWHQRMSQRSAEITRLPSAG